MTTSVESKQPAAGEVVQQGRDGPVGRREEPVLQVREGVAVGVPGLVVAEVHLHQADPGLDQPGGR
jgi:hypothetical protein